MLCEFHLERVDHSKKLRNKMVRSQVEKRCLFKSDENCTMSEYKGRSLGVLACGKVAKAVTRVRRRELASAVKRTGAFTSPLEPGFLRCETVSGFPPAPTLLLQAFTFPPGTLATGRPHRAGLPLHTPPSAPGPRW